MKAMYFSDKDTPVVFRKFIEATTSSLSTLSPQLFMKLSYKIFMNPRGIRDYQFSTLKPKEFSVKAHHGAIQVYFLKGGPKHILLTHGWADTSRSFETLISVLIKEGYSIWCFDHAGHGKSGGNASNLFAFIDGLKNVIGSIESKGVELHSLISHSMGGAAILNLDKEYLKEKKIVLIAAPVRFFEEMFNTFKRIGISKKVLTSLLEHVSKDYDKNWETIKPFDQKNKIHKNFLVVHDKKDKQCKYENMLELLDQTEAQLRSSEGLGHRRILKDTETLKAISHFLK